MLVIAFWPMSEIYTTQISLKYLTELSTLNDIHSLNTIIHLIDKRP